MINMGFQINCESISVSSDSNNGPKNAIFFHRFPDQVTNSNDQAVIPSCSIHSNIVATIQCTDCVRKGLPVRYSYHCSNKCFLDAWREHAWYHLNSNIKDTSNVDSDALGKLDKCDYCLPGDTVSWFDKKLEMVIPTGRKWVKSVGPSNVLLPLVDGVGFSLKLQCASSFHLQAAVCTKEAFVTDPFIQRLNLSPRSMIWLPNLKKTGLTQNLSKIGKFNVLTYNILSQLCAETDEYWYCPEWALTWEYRRKNLLHEMTLYGADILCLQEVQSDHFENFFKPQLEELGYSVVYKRKTNGVYTSNGDQFDGCAIFFRNDMFKKVISYELEYNKSALSLLEKLEPSLIEEARKRLYKDNVAVFVVLEMLGNFVDCAASLSRLCVVNTHLCADKYFPDVKLFQVSNLISEVEKIVDQRMPVLICGDINSFPGSDPYDFLTKHKVNPAFSAATDPLCIYQHLKLYHSMKLASAYASAFPKFVIDNEGERMTMTHPKTGEPLFTRLAPKMHTKKGELLFTPLKPIRGSTLDYIFYTEDSLEVKGLLELPNYKSVGRALPSPMLSSDHIALMGSFRITRPFSE